MTLNLSCRKRINREIDKYSYQIQEKFGKDYCIYLYNDDENISYPSLILSINKNNDYNNSNIVLKVPNDYPFKPYKVLEIQINNNIINNYLKYIADLSFKIKKIDKDILYNYLLIYNKIKPKILYSDCMCCNSLSCSNNWSPAKTFIDIINEYLEISSIVMIMNIDFTTIWQETRLSILNQDIIEIILDYCIDI
jgi:hypothetical protein|tara:strand:+ start:8735 stop:9316 length:582 start_codon:yes stop_codon:yes gene_type:complete